MALVLNAVAGTVGYNSYATVAECTDYATMKLNTAWAALTTAQKEATLIWATKLLNSLVFRGQKTDPLQPNEFPRAFLWRSGNITNIQAEDSALYGDYLFDSTTAPQFIKDAACDVAIQLGASDTTAPTGLEGFKSIKIDTISIEALASDRPSWFNTSVRLLCWRWLINQSKYNVATQRVG